MIFSAARIWMVLAVGWMLSAAAWAADLKNRSTSQSGQFIVYCDDRAVRSRVVSYAEELKTDVLQILREHDGWSTQRAPVVVTIDPATPGEQIPPVQVRWVNTVAGPKIDVIVRIGDDLAEVFLQRHLLKAMLLEWSYRDRPAPESGSVVVDPPWWLTEGLIEVLRMRNGAGGTDVFKSIVNTEKLPSLDRFLSQPPVHLDSAAGVVDRACAMCLVEALLDLPNGGGNLVRFIESWPANSENVRGALAAQFPMLAESEQSLAKWWTLQLARYAAGDRISGMTLEDSDRELTALLSFEIPVDKNGRMQRFSVGDFEAFVKYPAARFAMQTQQVRVVAFTTKAHPLFRPILAEYEQIFSQLSVKKTRHIADRIASIERYRRSIIEQMSQITDYLNWYEATQPAGRSGAFEPYLRRAEKLNAPAPIDPRITEYLDKMEEEFAPLAPNALPGMTPAGAASR